MRRFLIVLIAALGLAATAATAATLSQPSADYSANRVIETAEGEIRQTVYASGDKERVEMTLGGMQMVNILRRDKQVMWTLMPAQRMYMEIDLKQALAQQPASGPEPGMEITEMGAETVDGIQTTKYRMVASDRSAGGFLWLTKENIPVKMDMLAKDGNDEHRIVMRLENLQVGRQQPAQFELPTGFNKLPAMGGFGGMPTGQ